MNENYGRDIDLNLLRVFVVVAESASVTAAGARLYLTQPAVSAALRRLSTAVGAPLFTRLGRGLVLTTRGQRLLAEVRPHLAALIDAALVPPRFDPKTSERTFRVGLSDAAELWLLPPLLRVLSKQAPGMRLIALPVQFRNVAAALVGSAGEAPLDVAITVADELPAGIHRENLFSGEFVCLFDPRQVKLGRRLTEGDYFAQSHVIVSYNGDLRGIVEDLLHKQRRVRCSVSSFANLGALLDGTPLVATVPALVARQIRVLRPHLTTRPLPFRLPGAYSELLWPAAVDDDEPGTFLRARIRNIAAKTAKGQPGRATSYLPLPGTRN